VLDLIKRFGHVIAAAIIAWYAYSGVEAARSKKATVPKLDRIPAASFPLRAKGEADLEVPKDPFYREWAPYGPEYSTEAIAARKRAEQDRQDAEVKAARAARAKAREKANAAKATKRRREGLDRFHPFTLRLDAVLAGASGGVARISGHTLRLGDAVPGCDKAHPPVLSAIRGDGVTITYRGTRLRLDITKQPEHTVKAPPSGAAN